MITLYLKLDEEFVKNVVGIRRWRTPNEEVEFEKIQEQLGHEKVDNGILYRFMFDNRYGASVIKHEGSYGFDHDLWEVAVLYDDKLCYSTPVTCDVEGYCNDREVNRILHYLKNYDGKSDDEFEFRDEFYEEEEA